MGILNVTPDSFFDKGAHFAFEKAIERAKQIVQEGADILDIGGASSNPRSVPTPEAVERERVMPVIEALASQLSIPLSIDTDKPRIAREAVEKGARILNDIYGFQKPEMVEVAASCKADLCVMHMQGTPQTMQIAPFYPEGVIPHILHFFEKQIETLVKAGVKSERIILDPGIGFGKTVEQNLEILQNLAVFKKFGLRILIGASRKSFLSKILGKSSIDLLPATLAIHTISLMRGADILRVHDVKEHRDILNLSSRIV